jgi:hypothetical protein
MHGFYTYLEVGPWGMRRTSYDELENSSGLSA